MPKRKTDDVQGHEYLSKRRRVGPHVKFEDISDELVLRILSFLVPHVLGSAARTSKRLHRLANDNESWKERYYARWVRPRVLQIPSVTPISKRDIPRYSAKSANWLDHRHLVFPVKITDWKWQYRIRNNWHRGTCNLQSLEVSQPPAASTIIKTHGGVVFEAASTGLRAWSSGRESTPVAAISFCNTASDGRLPVPTAMAVDTSFDVPRLGIGFADSSFRYYEYVGTRFAQYSAPQHFLDHMEPVSALAISFPYVFALVGNKNFMLKRLRPRVSNRPVVWQELAWLRSNRGRVCLPSLGVRKVGPEIAASIAYTSELLDGNWCLGIQELRVSCDAFDATESRSPPSMEAEAENNASHKSLQWQTRSLEAWTPAFPTHPHVDSRPKALSYSHPYLLAALPDNTLMVYLATSTANGIHLSSGNRLWGHTSGISGAEVNGRGKAVTTSTKGGEIRVWDLEGLARGTSQGRTSTPLVPVENSGVPGSSSFTSTRFGSGAITKLDEEQLAFVRSSIAFDEEQVMILGERRNERTLSRYDFTR